MGVKEASATYPNLSLSRADAASLEHKQTDVGSIPKDWSVLSLGSLARSIHRGASPRPIDDPVWFDRESSIGWVRISDVTRSGRYLLETTQFLSALGVRHSRYLPAGALIMSICATVGRPIETRIDVCIHDGFVVFDTPFVDQSFLFHVLKDLEPRWSSKGQTGSQMNLNTGLIKSTVVPIPPRKAEQKAIAEALSDADALIESLQHLIAKKRQIKQGAMQSLLTGQQRLPGFAVKQPVFNATQAAVAPRDWSVRSLAELCSMKSGEAITTAAIDQASAHPCYGGNGLRGFTGRYTHDGSYVLIGRQGALCGNVSVVSGKFFASEHAVVVTAAAQTDTRWLALVLDQMRLNQYSESSAQPGLSVAKLLQLTALAPSNKGEQRAIATVLTDMESEIVGLETRLSKTREIKQGMMQALLTGAIRLPLTEAA